MNSKRSQLFIGIVVMITMLVGTFTLHTSRAHAASADNTPLAIPFLSQYQGQPTQDVDCGPTAVAMLVAYYTGTPDESAGNFITAMRTATNDTQGGDTTPADLETALSAQGLTYAEITNSASPQPDVQMQAMEQAVASGRPVIALVHGADLGRGQAYGDHYVVVTGFSSDGQTVFLNDPDDQSPKLSGWIQGGQISIPLSTFAQAAYDASPAYPYGIIVGKDDPATPSPGPIATIHQVDSATCASRDDFFEVYGAFADGQTECWASQGTANVTLANVSQISSGNNAGYVVASNTGQSPTITYFEKWQTLSINQDITQIVIFA